MGQKRNIPKHLYWDYNDHMKGSSYLMPGEAIFKWWQEEISH